MCTDTGLSEFFKENDQNGVLNKRWLVHYFTTLKQSFSFFLVLKDLCACWRSQNTFSLCVCCFLRVYFHLLLGTSLCKPVYLCLAWWASVNHIMRVHREEEDKSPDTFVICSFIWIMKLFVDGITDYSAASSSIMVCPVCLVGLLFDWIMTHWAATRQIDEEETFCCSFLYSRWWTVTFFWNYKDLAEFQEITVSLCCSVIIFSWTWNH